MEPKAEGLLARAIRRMIGSAMPDRQETLARIQERIVEGDLRVYEQIARIERLIEQGYDATEAKELLRQLEQILDQWHVRRRLILDEIACQEAPEP